MRSISYRSSVIHRHLRFTLGRCSIRSSRYSITFVRKSNICKSPPSFRLVTTFRSVRLEHFPAVFIVYWRISSPYFTVKFVSMLMFFQNWFDGSFTTRPFEWKRKSRWIRPRVPIHRWHALLFNVRSRCFFPRRSHSVFSRFRLVFLRRSTIAQHLFGSFAQRSIRCETTGDSIEFRHSRFCSPPLVDAKSFLTNVDHLSSHDEFTE